MTDTCCQPFKRHRVKWVGYVAHTSKKSDFPQTKCVTMSQNTYAP